MHRLAGTIMRLEYCKQKCFHKTRFKVPGQLTNNPTCSQSSRWVVSLLARQLADWIYVL